jgi:protein phosphatase
MLLFATKVEFPEHVFMVRGNHETESLSRAYGFYRELTAKYSAALYRAVLLVFSSLPLCAVIGDCIFCVHGGISPLLSNLTELENRAKPRDFSRPGLFTDMVWSDPSIEIECFARNPRGCGCLYGPEALAQFLAENNLDLMIRSHEACEDGTSWPFEGDAESCEDCVTVFSTSNYCEQGNAGAVLFVDADLLVDVEVFPALTPDEVNKQRIVMPYWLSDLITRKKKGNPVKVEQKLVKCDENNNQANVIADV